MLLTNLYTLCAFPFEAFGIGINQTLAPEASARLGIRFRNVYYDNGNNILSWTPGLSLKQGGSVNFLQNHPLYSYFYDPLFTKTLVQPTNFSDLPTDFPVFYNSVSSEPYSNIFLNFKGGTSAITVFPTRVYPKINLINNRSFSISAGVLPLSGFDYEISKDEYYSQIKHANIKPLSGNQGKVILPSHAYVGPSSVSRNMFPDIFYSAHKNNFVWKTVTSNPLQGIVFNHDVLPSNPPYNKNIIPQSFTITFPVSTSYVENALDYILSYSSSIPQINRHHLSAIELEPFALKPVVTTAYLNASAGTLFVQLNSGYSIPKDSQITISYETSALSYNKATSYPSFVQGASAAPISVNNYTVSTENPPYLYNYKFTLSGSNFAQRNAFTINFSPSAIIIPNNTTSAVFVSTVMVDNFFQIHYPIEGNSQYIIKRFYSENNDVNLSAIDINSGIIYTTTQWMPGSAVLSFVNRGDPTPNTIYFNVSSVTDSIWTSNGISFILNKDKVLTNLFITEQSDTSARILGSMYPSYNPEELVTWEVYPPENIELYNYYTLDPIPLGQPVPADSLDILIHNLGVDTTTITLYSHQYGTSASTVWVPTPSVYNNVSMVLSGYLNDFDKIKTAYLSAYFVKNGLYYPVPQDANIIWREIGNDPKGVINFRDSEMNYFYEDTVYPSIREYTNIYPSISTNLVSENPQNVIFNIVANVFSPYYNFSENVILYAREYPNIEHAISFLFETVSPYYLYYYTHNIKSRYLPASANSKASLNTTIFDYIPSTKIQWDTPMGTLTGSVVYFPMYDDYCITVKVISAQPPYGGFGYYNFEDSLCLQIIGFEPPALDYIAFPEYKFFPTQKLSIDDNSYLQTAGMSGIDSCSTNAFIISTFGYFDKYYYRIGEKLVTSNSNVVNIDISYSDISANNSISISAYNSYFLEHDDYTYQNTTYSDYSNIFKQYIFLYPQPPPNSELSISSDIFDLDNSSTTYFNVTLNHSQLGISFKESTFRLILDSIDGQRISDEFTGYGANINIPSQFTHNPNDFFFLPEDSFKVFTLYASGNVIQDLENYPKGCPISESFITTPYVTLTAFDGARIEIFTEKNIYKTNENITIYNKTNQSLPIDWTYFVLDDGNGNQYITYDINDEFNISYPSTGLYNISISGFYANSALHIDSLWEDFFIIKDEYEQFNPDLSREFPDDLILPYSCDEIIIPANSWQHQSSVLNSSFEKIRTNFNFLSSSAYSYNINVPKHIVGWASEHNGILKWRYNKNIPTSVSYSDVIEKINDVLLVDDKILLLNGDKFEIRYNNFNLDVIYSSNMITEGETFENPIEMAYDEELNNLIILDEGKKSVFVFKLNNNGITLTHYWGGVGERSSRTKLNNPTDLSIDSSHNIFIVDSESLVVKIYNRFLNWIFNLEHVEWNENNKPISISISNGTIYILTENQKIYLFDSSTYAFKNTIKLRTSAKKIYTDTNNEGILYVIGNDNVYVYMQNGVFINQFTPSINASKLSFHSNEIYAFNDFVIVKVVNYSDKKSVLNNNSLPIWDWNSIFIDKNESINDLVLNDSVKKIHDNIFLLANDINYKFTILYDEFDNFVNQDISPIETHEKILSASSYQILGINELVSYETVNRHIHNICIDLDRLKTILNPRKIREGEGSMCWTWKFLSMDDTQYVNPYRKPISWYEMRADINVLNPDLSGLKWKDLMDCQGEINAFPVCWTWEFFTCCKDTIITMTWEDLQCDGKYPRSWEDLEDNCCEKVSYFFDNCIKTC